MSANKHRKSLSGTYRPAFEDYFPRLVRGHSLGTHQDPCPANVEPTRRRRTAPSCASEGCSLSRKDGKGNQHFSQQANIDQYNEERENVAQRTANERAYRVVTVGSATVAA